MNAIIIMYNLKYLSSRNYIVEFVSVKYDAIDIHINFLARLFIYIASPGHHWVLYIYIY